MVQKNGLRLIRLLLLPAALSGPLGLAEPPAEQAFVTWNAFEPDKCASVWLIKRFISLDAHFEFFDPNASPPPGTLFDTPEAQFRRRHNQSTYETLLEHYRLADTRAIHIGRIMHDIEVNLWERKALPETRRVESELSGVLSRSKPEEAVDFCLSYFDHFALITDPDSVPAPAQPSSPHLMAPRDRRPP